MRYEKLVLLRLKTGNSCPSCRQGTVKRAKRQDWMRRLPRTKYYKCTNCKARFLGILWFSLGLPKIAKKVV